MEIELPQCLLCSNKKVPQTSVGKISLSQFLFRFEKERGCLNKREVDAFLSDSGNLNYEVCKCSHCGLIYSNPMVAGDKFFYELIYKLMPATGMRWEFERFREEIETFATALKETNDGRILDIGCGDGSFVNYVASLGYKARGVDFNADRINSANKSTGQTEFISADFTKDLPHIFDGEPNVTIWHVLEHLQNPVSLLKQLNKILPTGGRCFVSIPSDKFALEKLSEVSVLQFPPHHMTRWNPEAIKLLAIKTGFTLAKHWYEPPGGAIKAYAVRFGKYLISHPRQTINLFKQLLSTGNLVSPEAISPLNEEVRLNFLQKKLAYLYAVLFWLILKVKLRNASGMAQMFILHKN